MTTSDSIKTGGPAFPRSAQWSPDGHHIVNQQTGMTLRDYFAAQAIAGMHARDTYDNGQATPEQRAALAYIDADAMLKARGEDR